MVKFATQTTGYAVCDACKSMLVRQDLNVEKIGVSAGVQEDGSPLQIGCGGKYKNVGFEIVGRIQVNYPSGFWNEWYAAFDNGNEGWIGEAQGNYFVSFRIDAPDTLPPFEHLLRGVHITLSNRLFVVTDVQRAQVVACEGSLPWVQQGGYEAPVADLRSDSGVAATLDYSEQPPLVFLGEYQDFGQLHFNNLREVEGW